MENEVVKIIKDYELKSGISLPKPYLAISRKLSSFFQKPAGPKFNLVLTPTTVGTTYITGDDDLQVQSSRTSKDSKRPEAANRIVITVPLLDPTKHR